MLLKIGHRGTLVDFDENTIGAFKKAVEYGADYIEFDIHRTKDGQLIVMHDKSLNRTTTGSGLIKNCYFSEILNYETKIKHEHIPRLFEILDKFRDEVNFIIELKEEGIREYVLNLVNEIGLLNKCVLSGRRLNDLILIKNSFPEAKICYNITKGHDLRLKDFLKLENLKIKQFNLDMISLKSKFIIPEFIDKCQKNEILALSWDFLYYQNPLEEIKSLINLGIDGILFDDYKKIPIIKQWEKKD
ncbi:MAG: hypothetical protein EU529_02735 [Promethearchaeota archaeon]|nr:MAG: hypothetical protein EU529_02735 [Candidatus Lokiarchaeota archaeon]